MRPGTFLLLGLALTLFSCSKDTDLLGEDPYAVFGLSESDEKVAICHYDPDTDTFETLYLPEEAVQAHLDHGDNPGECVK